MRNVSLQPASNKSRATAPRTRVSWHTWPSAWPTGRAKACRASTARRAAGPRPRTRSRTRRAGRIGAAGRTTVMPTTVRVTHPPARRPRAHLLSIPPCTLLHSPPVLASTTCTCCRGRHGGARTAILEPQTPRDRTACAHGARAHEAGRRLHASHQPPRRAAQAERRERTRLQSYDGVLASPRHALQRLHRFLGFGEGGAPTRRNRRRGRGRGRGEADHPLHHAAQCPRVKQRRTGHRLLCAA